MFWCWGRNGGIWGRDKRAADDFAPTSGAGGGGTVGLERCLEELRASLWPRTDILSVFVLLPWVEPERERDIMLPPLLDEGGGMT